MDSSKTASLHSAVGLPEIRSGGSYAKREPAGDAYGQIFTQSNATATEFPDRSLVHELFEAQVLRTPDATAVVFEGNSLTYAELNARANQLARHLRRCDIGVDTLVGICIDRSLEMVIGLVGILKSGGAYVPLDPRYPPDRLSSMVQDSNPALILTQQSLADSLAGTSSKVVALDSEWGQVAAEQTDDLREAPIARADNLAYVIFTSGSTGRPKGAMNEHRALVNRLCWMQNAYQLTAADAVLQKTPFSFDVSVWEFFWTLMTGARLVVARPEGHKDPGYMADLIEEQQITTLHFVPSMLQSFLTALQRGRCSSLRHIICSGEELPAALQRKAFELFPAIRLSNLYGPTEAAIDVTAWECRPEDTRSRVPIGYPISNIQMYVLDPQGIPVAAGVTGELYIGGVGVGRGYLRRPDLTAERFLADPFSADSCARMYKTGDLARWRADGALEYLGRNDFQVKIRGFRIELGEIEAQLTSNSLVTEAVVMVREDRPGDPQLVAYVTIASPTSSGRNEESRTRIIRALRRHLMQRLPEHMVPSAFVILGRLPLSPNGKQDRKALPAPQLQDYPTAPYALPNGETETLLVDIWKEVFGIERVGRRDHFFELGGHSLQMVRMMRRIRRAGYNCEARDVHTHPVLSELASFLALSKKAIGDGLERTTGTTNDPVGLAPSALPQLSQAQIDGICQIIPGGRQNIQDIYPLAPLQEGILFHHLLNEARADAYLLMMLLEFSSQGDLQKFAKALQATIARHDALRTCLVWEHLPMPLQVVVRKCQFALREAPVLTGNSVVAQLIQRMQSPETKMDLRIAPLIELEVAEDPTQKRHYGLLKIHHQVCDNESLDALLTEIVEHIQGRTQHLPLAIPYRNHINTLRAHTDAKEVRAYFSSRLGDVEEPTAPFGVMEIRGDGSDANEARLTLSTPLQRRLRIQAREEGVSAATLFHAAWAAVASGATNRDSVVFGTVLSGRARSDWSASQMLGMFINSLPLRINLRDQTVRQLIHQIQRELMELISYEHASLADAQRCSGLPADAPLFTSLVNYRHRNPTLTRSLSECARVNVLETRYRTNYPILVSIDDVGDEFQVSIDTDRRINAQQVMQEFQCALESVVGALEDGGHPLAGALDILSPSERAEIFQISKGPAGGWSCERRIHTLFADQVRRTPSAVAVYYGSDHLTYAQLNSRANELARYLLENGASAGALIGIHMERSFDMVVALLSTLKCGAAYLPLDPNYPRDRLEYMLTESKPQFVLSQSTLERRFALDLSMTIMVDRLTLGTSSRSEQVLPVTPSLDESGETLYAMYTSGSTGRPKGVVMPHRALVNLVEWHREQFRHRGPQKVLQFAALSFDVATQEIFSTLCTGDALVLLEEGLRRDPRALLELIGRYSIQRIFVPPLMLQALAETSMQEGVPAHSILDVVTAGEQLRTSPEIVEFFKKIPDCRLHNHYGPTETHVVAALTLPQDPTEWPLLPNIGSPLPNCQIVVLNRLGAPVPLGTVGELYIAGACLADGYLHNPELTAQRFVRSQLEEKAHVTMYKTGDLGRWHPDGTLEFLGRNDGQVKIRGFRIEPGEIESQLMRHSAVRDAAVVARTDQRAGKQLIAYVTLRRSVESPVEKLRSHLKGLVPEYMLPSAIVVIETLPLTPSGKLDRRALPAPDEGAYVSRDYVPPQGALETRLAEVWKTVLNVQLVGRRDDFFELGGHSLSGMKMLSAMRSMLSIDVPLSAVFECPKFEQLAARLAAMDRLSKMGDCTENGAMEQLLSEVSSIPEAEARELMRMLRSGGAA